MTVTTHDAKVCGCLATAVAIWGQVDDGFQGGLKDAQHHAKVLTFQHDGSIWGVWVFWWLLTTFPWVVR